MKVALVTGLVVTKQAHRATPHISFVLRINVEGVGGRGKYCQAVVSSAIQLNSPAIKNSRKGGIAAKQRKLYITL
jgi:hypothetical protein